MAEYQSMSATDRRTTMLYWLGRLHGQVPGVPAIALDQKVLDPAVAEAMLGDMERMVAQKSN